jgi:hypothetical protein
MTYSKVYRVFATVRERSPSFLYFRRPGRVLPTNGVSAASMADLIASGMLHFLPILRLTTKCKIGTKVAISLFQRTDSRTIRLNSVRPRRVAHQKM